MLLRSISSFAFCNNRLPFTVDHAKMSIYTMVGRPLRLVPGTRTVILVLSLVDLSLHIMCPKYWSLRALTRMGLD